MPAFNGTIKIRFRELNSRSMENEVGEAHCFQLAAHGRRPLQTKTPFVFVPQVYEL